METWGTGQRALAGVRIAAGLGALAGAMEAVAMAASVKLSLGPVGFAVLGVTTAAVMGALGAVVGALTAPVQVALRNAWASTALTLQTALVAMLLCGWYLWQGSLTLLGEERTIPAIAMALMPFGFAGVAFFNARYFLRRAELGRDAGVGWGTAVGAGVVGLVGLATVGFALRDTGGTHALADDKNVVIVSVDGWSPPASPGPGLQGVRAGGTWFADAITPAPSVRAANATLLTGLHPLRHRALFDEDLLSWRVISLAELLTQEGYATGAFVSDPAVRADSGLEQGFLVYDDDHAPWIAGLLRVNLVKLLAPAVGGRSGDATVARFEGWLASKADLPFFAWVQLPAGSDPDPWIARIDAALASAGVLDETLLFVAGTRGEARSHGLSGDRGLYDDVVRVPLAFRAPGVEVAVREVPQQVRLMDVPGTAVTWLGLDPLDAEGVDLLDYATGRRSATVWSALIGRNADGDVLIGLRNNGVKYVRNRRTGAEELYHVPTDPAEARDLTGSQPDTLRSAQMLIGSEVVRLDQLLEQR